MIGVREVPAFAPAAFRKRPILGFVHTCFVARVRSVLRHQRVQGHARAEAGFVEIHEGIEACQRLCMTVASGARQGVAAS